MSIRIMSQIWSDGPEGQGELLVLLAMADFADDKGYCWPSMASIARMARMSERNVRRLVRKLEADGYLETSQSIGRSSNRYRVNPNPDNLSESDQPGHLRQPTRTNEAPNPDICDINPDIAVSGEPSRTIIEPSKNHQDDFDAFWSEVPRKVGKGQARKAYRAALKKTDAATLLSAMQRYAKERSGKDQQYTVHPATWLNGERWTDEPTRRPDDFHDKLERALEDGFDLRGTNISDRPRTERLSAPVQDTAAHERPDRPRARQDDGGRYQQEVASLLSPRRFG